MSTRRGQMMAACEVSGIDFPGDFVSYESFRLQAVDYLKSGATMYHGAAMEAILQHASDIEEVCPPAVLLAYALKMEGIMALSYTDNHAETLLQQKRLQEAHGYGVKYATLYNRMLAYLAADRAAADARHAVAGETDETERGQGGSRPLWSPGSPGPATRDVRDEDVLWASAAEAYHRASKWRERFVVDIQESRDLFGLSLAEDVQKQGTMTDDEFWTFYRETLRAVVEVLSDEVAKVIVPARNVAESSGPGSGEAEGGASSGEGRDVKSGGKETDVKKSFYEWWPIRGTLIALMRYGALGAVEQDHPDLRENDIDIIVGVNHEREWSRLSQRLTHAFERKLENTKCIVKQSLADTQLPVIAETMRERHPDWPVPTTIDSFRTMLFEKYRDASRVEADLFCES